jgi:hypothetical protein
MLLKMPIREAVRHTTERSAEHALGFAGGGTAGGGDGVSAHVGGGSGGGGGYLSDLTNLLGSAENVGAIIAALTTGNTTALTHDLDARVKTTAAGNLAKLMIALPKTLIADVAKQLASMVGLGGGAPGGKFGVPGTSSGAVGYLPANWRQIASFLYSHGFTKYAAAGVTGNIFAESGGDPEILQIGGGGGGGLIQWTPYPAGYITGASPAQTRVMVTDVQGTAAAVCSPGSSQT